MICRQTFDEPQSEETLIFVRQSNFCALKKVVNHRMGYFVFFQSHFRLFLILLYQPLKHF